LGASPPRLRTCGSGAPGTGLSASIPRPPAKLDPSHMRITGPGKIPAGESRKMLVESASAIFNTLRQRIPNIFPVSSPALRYPYRRVATEGGGMRWVGRGSAVFPLQSLARPCVIFYCQEQQTKIPL
jgi:hypothetical protein